MVEENTKIAPCPAGIVIIHGFEPTKLEYGINVTIIVGGGWVIEIRKCEQWYKHGQHQDNVNPVTNDPVFSIKSIH
jgi:hypothetical protein